MHVHTHARRHQALCTSIHTPATHVNVTTWHGWGVRMNNIAPSPTSCTGPSSPMSVGRVPGHAHTSTTHIYFCDLQISVFTRAHTPLVCDVHSTSGTHPLQSPVRAKWLILSEGLSRPCRLGRNGGDCSGRRTGATPRHTVSNAVDLAWPSWRFCQ